MPVEVYLTPDRSDELRRSSKWSEGATGFCSWGRLAEELRNAGVIHRNEEVVSFHLEDSGIQIRLRDR